MTAPAALHPALGDHPSLLLPLHLQRRPAPGALLHARRPRVHRRCRQRQVPKHPRARNWFTCRSSFASISLSVPFGRASRHATSPVHTGPAASLHRSALSRARLRLATLSLPDPTSPVLAQLSGIVQGTRLWSPHNYRTLLLFLRPLLLCSADELVRGLAWLARRSFQRRGLPDATTVTARLRSLS